MSGVRDSQNTEFNSDFDEASLILIFETQVKLAKIQNEKTMRLAANKEEATQFYTVLSELQDYLTSISLGKQELKLIETETTFNKLKTKYPETIRSSSTNDLFSAFEGFIKKIPRLEGLFIPIEFSDLEEKEIEDLAKAAKEIATLGEENLSQNIKDLNTQAQQLNTSSNDPIKIGNATAEKREESYPIFTNEQKTRLQSIINKPDYAGIASEHFKSLTKALNTENTKEKNSVAEFFANFALFKEERFKGETSATNKGFKSWVKNAIVTVLPFNALKNWLYPIAPEPIEKTFITEMSKALSEIESFEVAPLKTGMSNQKEKNEPEIITQPQKEKFFEQQITKPPKSEVSYKVVKGVGMFSVPVILKIISPENNQISNQQCVKPGLNKSTNSE